MNGKLKTFNQIVIKPEIRFGQPTVRNTRIAVADILNLLEAGYRIDEIPDQYPDLTLLQVKQSIRFAVSILGNEETFQIANS